MKLAQYTNFHSSSSMMGSSIRVQNVFDISDSVEVVQSDGHTDFLTNVTGISATGINIVSVYPDPSRFRTMYVHGIPTRTQDIDCRRIKGFETENRWKATWVEVPEGVDETVATIIPVLGSNFDKSWVHISVYDQISCTDEFIEGEKIASCGRPTESSSHMLDSKWKLKMSEMNENMLFIPQSNHLAHDPKFGRLKLINKIVLVHVNGSWAIGNVVECKNQWIYVNTSAQSNLKVHYTKVIHFENIEDSLDTTSASKMILCEIIHQDLMITGCVFQPDKKKCV